jgi:hypothetical protein
MPDSFGLDAGFDLDFGIPRKRKRRVDSFDAETEASLMSTLGRTALSGVAATGNLLDVPGSMARDVLAGQNPFDQILDPFGSENRTTGRDLLRQTGMISNQDTTGNWWGGLAAEIALDPTTYLTFGGSALTKGGKAFKAAGVLDDAAKIGLKGGRHVGKRLSRMTTTAKEGFDLLDDAGKAAVNDYLTKNAMNLTDIADEPLQTLGRAALPFTDIGFNFGSGAISQGIASGLDLAGSALNKNLAVRVGRALFDPSVGGQVGHGAQQIAEEAYRAKWKAERAVKHEHVQLLKQMDEGFKSFNETMGPEIAARNTAAWDDFTTKLRDRGGSLTPEQTDAVSSVWKGYFEGYLKTDPGEGVQKLIKDIEAGGALDRNALLQKKAQPFYSKLAQVVQDKVGGKTSWDQLKATLKNHGVKDEEIRDMGIEAAFAGKKSLTKEEVLETFLENSVRVEEKVLGNPERGASEAAIEWLKRKGVSNDPVSEFGYGNPDDYVKLAMEHGAEDFDHTLRDAGAKFATYQVPGADPGTYREILLKIPPGEIPGAERGVKDYYGKHFDEQNVIAHARVDDITLPDGRKALRINEIQSDWHQKGAKEGYGPPKVPELKVSKDGKTFFNDQARIERLSNGRWQLDDRRGGLSGTYKTLEEAMGAYEEIISATLGWKPFIPDGPFKDSWQDLALKNVLRHAAEKGYDAVALVHGEDIAKAVGGPAEKLGTFYDEILTNKLKKLTKGGKAAIGEAATSADAGKLTKLRDELRQVEGRMDAADRAGNQQLYEALVNRHREMLDDIGYLEEKGIGGTGQPYRSVFEITPKLRESILKEGQPLYQKAGDTAKGAATFAKDGKALLQFFSTADVSTHLHEMSHVMRRHLTSSDDEIAARFVGATDGAKWTVDQEEKWARGFENYIRTGKAPSSGIKAVFDRLKEWMTSIYQKVIGSSIGGVKLTPEIKELYGRLIGSTPATRKASGTIAYEAYDKLVRLAGELADDAGSPDVEKAWEIMQEGGTNLPDAVKAKIKETAGGIRKLNKAAYDEYLSKGGKGGTITDRLADDATETVGFSHMPRSVDMRPKDIADLKNPKVLKSSFANAASRDAVARMIPTEIKNRMLQDQTVRDALKADHAAKKEIEAAAKAGTPLVTPPATDTAAKLLEQKYQQFLDPKHAIDDVNVGKTGHATELARWVAEHKQAPMHTASTVDDQVRYMTGVQTASRNLDAMHEIVLQNMDKVPGAGKVSVGKAFKSAGLSDEAIEHWSKTTGEAAENAFEEFYVPADVANALVATQRIYQEPEWLKEIGGALDTWNQFWKSAVTVPFPSFHSRNFTSGQFMNVATGLVSNAQEMAEYSGEVLQAMKMVATGNVPREIVEELYVNGVRGSHTRAMDLTVDSINQGLPGELQSAMGALGAFKKIKDEMGPSYFDALPGGKNLRAGLNMAGEAGGRVADKVEFMNRVPLYMYLTRKKGWSAAEAAAKVNELHVDYSQLTGFEKSAMRRLVPFYSFQRRIAPVILNTILERPGGFLAQSIKASADLHNEDPLTPEHVGSTLSIPNPLKNADYEGKSYITGFGLPHEQLLQYVGGPRAVLREAASQLNPIVKAPLEWATGQSFFQSGPGGKGRDIEELDPTLGRIYANVTGAEKPPKSTALEFFSANLPTSRVQTSLRQLTDPRKDIGEKAVNFLTGARITDVDLKAQERVVQNRALDLMKDMGARTFEKPYFPDELVEEMSPEEAAQADALELLQAVLADRQKKRKRPAGR